jgi:hypothetical protein
VVFGLQWVSAHADVGRLHSGHFEPVGWWLLRAFDVLNPVLFFVGIVLAWRTARGDTRVRLQRVLATVGAIMATIGLGNLNRRAGRPIPAEQSNLIQNSSFVLAHVGFLCAIFRHRIFDFGLAVDRALIFAIVGAILFAAIQLAHSLAGALLHFDERDKAVDRLFFRNRAEPRVLNRRSTGRPRSRSRARPAAGARLQDGIAPSGHRPGLRAGRRTSTC